MVDLQIWLLCTPGLFYLTMGWWCWRYKMNALGGRGTLEILSFAILDLFADSALRETCCDVGDASDSEDTSSLSGEVTAMACTRPLIESC